MPTVRHPEPRSEEASRTPTSGNASNASPARRTNQSANLAILPDCMRHQPSNNGRMTAPKAHLLRRDTNRIFDRRRPPPHHATNP